MGTTEAIISRVSLIFKATGLTKRQFAEAIGHAYSFSAALADGRFVPSDEVIKDLCCAFSVNEDWLRTGSGEMFAPFPEYESELFTLISKALSVRAPSYRRRLTAAFASLTESDLTSVGQLILHMGERRMAAE